ncbi:hypothetical protein BJY00DRAFT_322296 [Aspergillus carlsbadensis]|nr:hypothetical protein BJY00DRAFT_322296 [Aspergillus carlsbadensis]
MQLEYHILLQSGIVKFVISKDQKWFLIHVALARSFLKKILKAPLNSKINKRVFGHCCKFVYLGNYSIPLLVLDPLESSSIHSTNSKTLSQVVQERWDPVNLTKNVFHPSNLSVLNAAIAPRLDGVVNTDPRADYANIFLCHAEVYRLGYRTNWVSLCAWSLHHLVHLLDNFTLFMERTGDIVQLLEFMFKESKYIEDMQQILRDYAVWNVEILMQNADF